MKTFKVKEDFFKEMRKKTLMRLGSFMLVVVIFGVVIASVNSKSTGEDINILPIYLPIVVIAIGFGLYRGINRQKSLLESYTLTITNNLVTREQFNTPTISIYFNDIKEIVKLKNGCYTIRGKEAGDLIVIPAQIDNHAELENSLQQIQPIVSKENTSFLEKYQGLSALVVLGLMICVYTSYNKIVVGLAGTTLIVLMMFGFIKMQTNKNVDNKTRKSVWWILVVLASVIMIMYFKLSGQFDLSDK